MMIKDGKVTSIKKTYWLCHTPCECFIVYTFSQTASDTGWKDYSSFAPSASSIILIIILKWNNDKYGYF